MPAIDYAARVKRGAELLDDKQPGWERQINLDYLALADSCRCVLGQLYGHYINGIAALVKAGSPCDLAELYAIELGFNVPASEMGDRRYPGPYRQLDELWITEIRARITPPPAIKPPPMSLVLELQLV